MQRAISVQSLHVILDDVVPLHAQVNEAPGLHLLAFSVEDVMSCCLVLDSCNQSFVIKKKKLKKKLHSSLIKYFSHLALVWFA